MIDDTVFFINKLTAENNGTQHIPLLNELNNYDLLLIRKVLNVFVRYTKIFFYYSI